MSIPLRVTQIDSEEIIPQKAIEMSSDEIEAPESEPYVISFAKYKDKICEIHLLQKNKAKRVVETLKIIGTKIYCLADFQKNNIDRFSVLNLGDYKKLYRGFDDDIEIKEIKLQDTGRLFYFDVEPEKTFYVVAITENHFETDKVRR